MDTAVITHNETTRVTTATWRGRTVTGVEPHGLEDAQRHVDMLTNLGVEVTFVVAP